MKSSGSGIVIIVCLMLLGYIWRGEIATWVTRWAMSDYVTPKVQCEVKNMSCADLVRMLNSFRSGRYYEASGKLLETSMEDTSMYRDHGAMVFQVKDGKKIIHNQGLAGREKGYMTVVFPNGYWIKYDDNGNFIEESK
ncbi:MAG: hypothetical protein J6Q05_00900 [Elusimicrobiaceae bacterium]|nr:hypothetical protein [Elusimicrobiaceae bacterium]